MSSTARIPVSLFSPGVQKRDALLVIRRAIFPPAWRKAWLAVAVALVLLLLSDLFAFESILVPSTSMEPTILPNERVLLAKWSSRSIRRFDVVVIRSRTLRERVVKRVIGLPGDRVRLVDSARVFINGRELAYDGGNGSGRFVESDDHNVQFTPGAVPACATRFGKDDLQLGPNEYFVLGDNRLASRDSRVIGPVPHDEIEGKLVMVWYSFDLNTGRIRWGRLLSTLR